MYNFFKILLIRKSLINVQMFFTFKKNVKAGHLGHSKLYNDSYYYLTLDLIGINFKLKFCCLFIF